MSSAHVLREWSLPRHELSLSLSPEYTDQDWSRRTANPRFVPRGARGPRCLLDMATNVVAINIGQITQKHVETMPPRLKWRIWHFLEARGLCLHAWTLFSQVLLKDEDGEKTLNLYRYRHHICRPTHGLRHYSQPLTASPSEFITHLAISGGCNFHVNEMLVLSDMSNLGVLEIIQPADELTASFPVLSDRLVRGWSEKPNPFPCLRVLRIWGDQATTQDSIRWVSAFPALALYDVMASREGWTRAEQRGLDFGWELASSGTTQSLLRDLMLLAEGEDGHVRRPRDMAQSIDSDLVSLCGDSQCAVRFVDRGQAPQLVDYLTDTAKLQTPPWERANSSSRGLARSCRDAAFEAWAFWLYSMVGQLTDDEDLTKMEGGGPKTQAVAGPFVLPSKPMASVFLGHSGRGGITAKPSYVRRGMFSTRQYTFTRPSVLDGVDYQTQTVAPEVPIVLGGNPQNLLNPEYVASSIREQKKRRLDDMLGALSR